RPRAACPSSKHPGAARAGHARGVRERLAKRRASVPRGSQATLRLHQRRFRKRPDRDDAALGLDPAQLSERKRRERDRERSPIEPMLENPSLAFNQQPYFYVELLNLTRGTTLYTGFNTAGQTGVPWHTTTSIATGNATQWLDWALVDIAPAGSALSAGDQVQP